MGGDITGGVPITDAAELLMGGADTVAMVAFTEVAEAVVTEVVVVVAGGMSSEAAVGMEMV